MLDMCSGCGGMEKMMGTTSLCRTCWEDLHGPIDDEWNRQTDAYLAADGDYLDQYAEDFDDY